MYARQRGSRASSEPRKRHSGSRKRKQSTASTTLKNKGHHHEQAEILLGLPVLPLADLLGHQGVAAAAEHHAQGGDEEDHGHGDVDGGQAVGIHPPCHKDAVYGGVDVHDRCWPI